MSNKKKSDGKKLTPTQTLPDIGCGTLPTTILTRIKSDNAYLKIEFRDMLGSIRTLVRPINYRTLNSSSKIPELKHTLMQPSQLQGYFHRFLVSARTGCTRYHNALANKISSDCTSEYIDGFIHSVFAESLNLSQVKDSGTQIHTIRYYIAEIYLVLIHWWGLYAILLLCWGTRCLITWLSYTQQYYIVVVYSTVVHCWTIPTTNTLLR